jgi:hypothetical protein
LIKYKDSREGISKEAQEHLLLIGYQPAVSPRNQFIVERPVTPTSPTTENKTSFPKDQEEKKED